MQTALKTLKSVAEGATKPVFGDDGGEYIDYETRQRAASELGKLAMQILTKTKSGGAPAEEKSDGSRDLFDKPSMGPWKLALAALS